MRATDTRGPGDVVSTTVMGQPTLILGSVRAANDLLDAKGACPLSDFLPCVLQDWPLFQARSTQIAQMRLWLASCEHSS